MNIAVSFSNDSRCGCSWVHSGIVFSFKPPMRERRLITASPDHFLKAFTPPEDEKEDKVSLCRSSWLFCLKGAEGSPPKRRQVVECRVGDLLVCSQPFITPATTVAPRTGRPQSPPNYIFYILLKCPKAAFMYGDLCHIK